MFRCPYCRRFWGRHGLTVCTPAVGVTATTAVIDHWIGDDWPAIALVADSGAQQVIDYSPHWTPDDRQEAVVAASRAYRLPVL